MLQLTVCPNRLSFAIHHPGDVSTDVAGCFCVPPAFWLLWNRNATRAAGGSRVKIVFALCDRPAALDELRKDYPSTPEVRATFSIVLNRRCSSLGNRPYKFVLAQVAFWRGKVRTLVAHSSTNNLFDNAVNAGRESVSYRDLEPFFQCQTRTRCLSFPKLFRSGLLDA
jgi:hypothetical protein